MPQAPDFPNGVPGMGPDFPNMGKPAPVSPFSLNDDVTPGAFDNDDRLRPTAPYTLVVRGEFLNWRVTSGRLGIPMVTTGTFPEFGAANQASTQGLFGPTDYGYGNIIGGRATLGLATGILPPIEASGFWLNRNRVLFTAVSDGSAESPVIARPLFLPNFVGPDGLPGLHSAAVVGYPGFVTGSIQIGADISLWGAEANFVLNLGKSDVLSVDVLLGYRYADLREGLTIGTTSIATTATGLQFANSVTAPGQIVQTFDNFATRNQFNGGQFGLRSTLSCWRFNILLDAKLAMGVTRQEMRIDGSSTLGTAPGAARDTITVHQGVQAVASNSGSHVRNDFSIIPEGGVQLGYQISRNFRVFVGGNIFYMSSVIRPGDAVSSTVDSRLVPTFSQPLLGQPFDPLLRTGPPTYSFRDNDFWGYGYSLGLEISF